MKKKLAKVISVDPVAGRKEFQDWYLNKFQKSMPVYLQSETKKKLVTEFQNETGLTYIS